MGIQSRAFPWLKHLPEDAAREFFRELHEQLDEAVSFTPEVSSEGFVARVDPVIASWKATAEIHADPELLAHLTKDHDVEKDFVEAPRPEGSSCPTNPTCNHDPDCTCLCCAPDDDEEIECECGKTWPNEAAMPANHNDMDCKVEPRYKPGSVIHEDKGPGSRRWEVVEVRNAHYRVRALFSGVTDGRMEPEYSIWEFGLCEAHTKLEWQKPSSELDGIIDAHGRSRIPKVGGHGDS